MIRSGNRCWVKASSSTLATPLGSCGAMVAASASKKALVFVLGAALFIWAPVADGAQTDVVSIDVDGSNDLSQFARMMQVTTDVPILSPNNTDKSMDLPLAAVLHDKCSFASEVRDMFEIEKQVDELQFRAVFPEASRNPYFCSPECGEVGIAFGCRAWNTFSDFGQTHRDDEDKTDDVNYLQAVIRAASNEYATDTRRIWLVGDGLGSVMAYKFACEFAHNISAVVGYRGLPPTNSITGDEAGVNCPAMRQEFAGNETVSVHVLHVHGEEDEVMPFDGGRAKGHFTEENATTISAEQAAIAWSRLSQCNAENRDVIDIDLTGDGRKETSSILFGKREECNKTGSAELMAISGVDHDLPQAMTSRIGDNIFGWLRVHGRSDQRGSPPSVPEPEPQPPSDGANPPPPPLPPPSSPRESNPSPPPPSNNEGGGPPTNPSPPPPSPTGNEEEEEGSGEDENDGAKKSDSDGGDGLGNGEISGIVIGCVAFASIVAASLYVIAVKRRQRNEATERANRASQSHANAFGASQPGTSRQI